MVREREGGRGSDGSWCGAPNIEKNMSLQAGSHKVSRCGIEVIEEHPREETVR